MGSLIVGIVALVALALLAALWRWRAQTERQRRSRQAADRAHAAFQLPALAGAAAGEVPVGELEAEAALEWEVPSLAVLQRQFHLQALGGTQPEDGQWQSQDKAQQAVIRAVSAQLERADLSPRYTPRRPQLLPQLIHNLNDTSANSRSIAAIIGKDPVLTGNLLRIANSALYRAQPRTVDTLERAVTMVGTQGVREIITAALMQPVMATGSGGDAHFLQQVWDYTLRMSVAAADHARSVEQEDGFSAQLMGLLLGLGEVVVMQATDDVYAKSPQVPRSALAQLELLERFTVPTAARIARSWELSALIVTTLRDLDQDNYVGRERKLQRSLDFGRSAAASAMLARAGLFEDARALAVLEAQVPEHVAQWVWKRLREDHADAVVPA